MNPKQILLSFLVCTFSTLVYAQKQTSIDKALRYIEQKRTSWGLSETDIADLYLHDRYTSRHNQVTHLYFEQRYQEIPLQQALTGVHIDKNGAVAFATNRFEANIQQRVNTTKPQLSPLQALETVASQLGLDTGKRPTLLNQSEKIARFDGGSISTHPVTVELSYAILGKQLRLSWAMTLVDPNSSDAWRVYADALTGKVLLKNNATIYCSFPEKGTHDCHQQTETRSVRSLLLEQAALQDGAIYNVFPAPLESPIHGPRVGIVNPADPVASPFGWHDINGVEGPEYTITRGNNVHAYLDADGDNLPDEDSEPDGGPELIFDFPIDGDEASLGNQDAAITQLFYMNNLMHDFTYHYGFDEAAGNFQQNLYPATTQAQGKGGDIVNAEARDGAGFDNANFLTLEDGVKGRMQMFLWSSGAQSFEVSTPATLAGVYASGNAQFGPRIFDPVTATIAEGFSDAGVPEQGCTPYTNAEAVTGKIALVDRGDCFFQEKTIAAQEAGALACIICNQTDEILNPGGVDTLAQPEIPTILLGNTICTEIRAAIAAGDSVQVTVKSPTYLDASFDNGITAHEYGHGISNRLTGGPSSSFCLFNDEQMGEGWSDFFALVTSVRPGEDGTLPRGIGTYVSSQTTSGSGIRRQRYSTDMNVNTQTYDDVMGTSAPHPLGEIWVSTLWDLYWEMVDKYEWDEDLYTGTGGNNKAIQLVMDGMKLQACNPGFIDGRDAIVAADIINNGGENECLIWEVFARRGLGWSATQGSSEDRNDNTQAFDLRPECVKELKISKNSTPLIQAGDVFTVDLRVVNDRDELAEAVVVTDEIPDGAVFVAGSANGIATPELNGNLLSFDLGDMPAGSIVNISYQLESDPARPSVQEFFDDLETGMTSLAVSILTGNTSWRLSTDEGKEDSRAWKIANTLMANDHALRTIDARLVTGQQPVFRFEQNYEIDPGLDAGIVEVSTNNGLTWTPVPEEQVFRNGYTGRAVLASFEQGQSVKGFWGESDGFIQTYVDLSDYIGENVMLRLRYNSNTENPDFGVVTDGWIVDNIEFIDMVNYNGEACVQAAGGLQSCTLADERGTIVETATVTPVIEIDEQRSIGIFPNPATDQVQVQLNGLDGERLSIELITLDGRKVLQQQIQQAAAFEQRTLAVGELPRGIYFVKIATDNTTFTERIVLQ